MNKAGLRKVVKTVRGKKGAVRRSYWVRAQEAGKGIIKRHGGKIAAGALLATALVAGHYLSNRPKNAEAIRQGRNRMADRIENAAANKRGVFGSLLGFNSNVASRVAGAVRAHPKANWRAHNTTMHQGLGEDGGTGGVGAMTGFLRGSSTVGAREAHATTMSHNSFHFSNLAQHSERANTEQYGMTGGVGTSGWNTRSMAPVEGSTRSRRRGENRPGRSAGGDSRGVRMPGGVTFGM